MYSIYLHELEVVHILSPRQPLNVDVLVDMKAVERRLEHLHNTQQLHERESSGCVGSMRPDLMNN